MQKKYVIWNPEKPGDPTKIPKPALQEMVYFGENSNNCRFPNIEVNEENQVKLQKYVEEYVSLIKEEKHQRLSLVSFFKGKGIDIEPVDEFEEPRNIFVLLIYFKEICKLTEFDPIPAVEME